MSEAEKTELIQQINTAVDEIRHHLKVDGGDVEIVDITDDFCVRIKWLGNCESCTMSSMTLRAGLEQTIKAKLPQIKSIEAVNGVGVS